jgi:hypothetical protein
MCILKSPVMRALMIFIFIATSPLNFANILDVKIPFLMVWMTRQHAMPLFYRLLVMIRCLWWPITKNCEKNSVVLKNSLFFDSVADEECTIAFKRVKILKGIDRGNKVREILSYFLKWPWQFILFVFFSVSFLHGCALSYCAGSLLGPISYTCTHCTVTEL